MTVAEFLAWEHRQDLRWEFDGFAPVAMTGGTVAHALIQSNLAVALGNRIRAGPCRFFGQNLKVRVAGSVRYPDGFVLCTPKPPGETTVDDPVVIFEVLSRSTAAEDRVVKAREYMRTPSVMRYVMLEQTRAAATVHARDGDRWMVSLLSAEDTLAMPEIGVEFPLAELYDGVDLPSPPDGDDEPG
jgi:Uma2 family endonuclease